MTKDDKEKQIVKAESQGTEAQEETQDLNIFMPEPVPLVLGKKKYLLRPLKLNQMRLLVKLSEISMKTVMGNKEIDLIIDCLSEILPEPDKKYLEQFIDVPTLGNIFMKLNLLNYAGVPKVKTKENPPGN